MSIIGEGFEVTEKFTKHDQEKPMLHLWPPRAFLAVGRVLTHGAKKYSPDNWRKVDDTGRYMGAALRHLFAYMKGEKYDADSGEPHLAHALCCIAFMLELDEEKPDTRPTEMVEEIIPGTSTYDGSPLTHVVSKSEEPAEKWADDVMPCGSWYHDGEVWKRYGSSETNMVSVQAFCVSNYWRVWAHGSGGWGWEEHPPEESIEAAKAAADKRLRGD